MAMKIETENQKTIDDKTEEDLAFEENKRKRNFYVVETLLNRKYEFMKILGTGSYGDVLRMKTPESKVVAVKIVPEEFSSSEERTIWPVLNHRNLQKIFEVIHMNESKTYCYLMEEHKISLFEIIEEEHELAAEMALQRIRKWFKQILLGLDYLHRHDICHADLKCDNILISHEDEAVITDFSFVQRTKSPITRYGLPLHYRPAESFNEYSDGEELVEGLKLDMWSFGMIAVETVTKHALGMKLLEVPARWSEYMYPVMYSSLKERNMKACIRKSLPNVVLEKSTFKDLHNFILMFLRLEPGNRPTPMEALEHKFLNLGSYEAPEDVIWKKKAKQSYIKSVVQRYQEKLNIIKQQNYSLNNPKAVKFTVISSQKVENEVILEKCISLPKRNDYIKKNKVKPHSHPQFIREDTAKHEHSTNNCYISLPDFRSKPFMCKKDKTKSHITQEILEDEYKEKVNLRKERENKEKVYLKTQANAYEINSNNEVTQISKKITNQDENNETVSSFFNQEQKNEVKKDDQSRNNLPLEEAPCDDFTAFAQSRAKVISSIPIGDQEQGPSDTNRNAEEGWTACFGDDDFQPKQKEEITTEATMQNPKKKKVGFIGRIREWFRKRTRNQAN